MTSHDTARPGPSSGAPPNRLVVLVPGAGRIDAAERWARQLVPDAGIRVVSVDASRDPGDFLARAAREAGNGAAVPVLLVPEPPGAPPRRLVVAVDGSGYARAALRLARALAGRHGADVVAVHAFRPMYLGAARSVSGMGRSAGLRDAQIRQTREQVAAWLREAGFGPEEAEVRVEAGDPATVILEQLTGDGSELVVMGSRGAGRAARALLGSVASGVLRKAEGPILVVTGEG